MIASSSLSSFCSRPRDTSAFSQPMDREIDNFAEFVATGEESELNHSPQTDIPVVSLHQSLLRQHHLSLNHTKEQVTSVPFQNDNHHQQQPEKHHPEQEQSQMLVSDLTVSRLHPHQTASAVVDVHRDSCACHLCSPMLRIDPKQRQHQVVQARPTSWTCSLCPLKYKRPADLNRHMKRKHGMSLMKNDKNVLVPIAISQQHKSDHQDLQPLNLSLKCALSDASIESAESLESEMAIGDDQPLDLSSNKNSPIDYRQKTLNKSSDHFPTEGGTYASVNKSKLVVGNFDSSKLGIPANQTSPLYYGRPSISAPAIRYRPFKCSECGRRSNWRWDLNKHIRTSNHPQAHLIELSEHVARATFHEVLKKDNSYFDPLLTNIQNLRPDSSVISVDVTNTGPQLQYKPFLCNACGYRSNYKCDMSKHIKLTHNTASVTLLTEDIAKETLESYEKHQSESQGTEKGQSNSHHQILSAGCVTTQEGSNYLVVKCNSAEGIFPFSSSHTVDARKTKKFKCSACPYRSNFRSDVGRHIRHKHDRATCRIVVMSEAEAASTLGEYMDTWARKKFVPSPNKRRCLVPLSCLRSGESYDALRVFESPFAVSSTTSTSESGTKTPLSSNSSIQAQESGMDNQVKTSKSKRWWKCSSCDYRDQSKDVIVQHWHYRHNNAPFVSSEGALSACDVLGLGCDSESSSLLEPFHGKNEDAAHSSETNDLDEEKLLEGTSPDSNGGTTPGVKMFSCNICPYKITSQELLNIHKSHHTAKEGNNLSCTFCPYFVCAAPLLSQHLMLHAEELKVFRQNQGPKVTAAVNNQVGGETKLTEETNVPMNLSSALPLRPCNEPERSQDKVSMFLMTNAIRSGGRTTYLCSQCPYVSCNRNDYLYHRQFHRPRPTAFKCPHCPYWVSQKRLLSQHYKVHEPDYQQRHRSKEFAEGKSRRGVEHSISGDSNNNIIITGAPSVMAEACQPSEAQSKSSVETKENATTMEEAHVPCRSESNEALSNPGDGEEKKGIFLEMLGLQASSV